MFESFIKMSVLVAGVCAIAVLFTPTILEMIIPIGMGAFVIYCVFQVASALSAR